MLLLCRGFNSHMLYPSLSARFPWRSATPLLPRARCPRPSACPTSMLISPYGNESGPAGQLILKRSPGPGARPPRSSQRPWLGGSAGCRCREPPPGRARRPFQACEMLGRQRCVCLCGAHRLQAVALAERCSFLMFFCLITNSS